VPKLSQCLHFQWKIAEICLNLQRVDASMSEDSGLVRSRQPDEIDDPLTILLWSEGAELGRVWIAATP
jgi:hypothetical protein